VEVPTKEIKCEAIELGCMAKVNARDTHKHLTVVVNYGS